MDNKIIIIYVLVFASVLILFRTIGLISFNNNELLGYVLVIYGLSLYYSSFLIKKKIALYFGSSLFLLGVIFLLIGSFDLQQKEQLLIPAFLFVNAISSLMLFLFDKSINTAMYATVILFAAGIGTFALVSPHGIKNFINNIISFSEVYWPVIIILTAVIVLVNREVK
ncbi:MAG: hypothetical protein PVF17_03600 [Ignavibacteria bacterium]|jgi:hypothetical protein